MTLQFEIVFFSLQPGCCLEEILPRLVEILGLRQTVLEAKLKRPGSVLVSGLTQAEARSLQPKLVAGGLLCNYRPSSATELALELEPKSFVMACPHCGRPNQIIEHERRRRCRHCRRHWSLWAMQQQAEPAPPAVPAQERRCERSATSGAPPRPYYPWLVWMAIGLLGAYGALELSPALVDVTQAGWQRVRAALAEEVQAWGTAIAWHWLQQDGTSPGTLPKAAVLDPFAQVWAVNPPQAPQAWLPEIEAFLQQKVAAAQQCSADPPSDWAWLLKLYETAVQQADQAVSQSQATQPPH